MKFKNLCIILGIITLFMGCEKVQTMDSITIEEESKVDKLVICTSGNAHTFKVLDEQREEIEFTRYPSAAVLGDRYIWGELNMPEGNIFVKALEDFSQETGIEIEIRFWEEYVGSSDCLQEMVERGDSLPDAMLFGQYLGYDYIRLAEQGYLLDFTEWIEKDETVLDSEQYYSEVIQGGRIGEKQYILPILFGMNAMITSESYLSQIGMGIPEEGYTYEAYIHLLEESCIAMRSEPLQEALYETSGMRSIGIYFPSILTAAAYPSYWDRNGELLLEKSVLTSILELMNEYYRQEFVSIPDWESREYYENCNDMRGKQRMLRSQNNREICEYVGIYLTGGRCGGTNIYHNLLTDAAYMQSVYEEKGESMVLRGLPTASDPYSYSANIGQMLIGFAGTEYPEAVYELGRYLMDYEYPVYYGFSVNQEITERQLEKMQTTELTVYPDWVWSSVEGGFSTLEEVKEATEHIVPLEEETVAIIEEMLNHIAGAGIPYSPLEYTMYTSMQQGVHNKEYTPEEAAEWLIEHLEEHQEVQENLKPFYDKEYEHMLLRWDEGE